MGSGGLADKSAECFGKCISASDGRPSLKRDTSRQSGLWGVGGRGVSFGVLEGFNLLGMCKFDFGYKFEIVQKVLKLKN